MAEKSPGTKEEKGKTAPVAEEFVLNLEKLATDELRMRLSPEDRRFLRELHGNYEQLMTGVVEAKSETDRAVAQKQFNYETELRREQARIAEVEVEQGSAAAQAERLRYKAQAEQARRQAESSASL